MLDSKTQKRNQGNKRKALVITFVFHLLIFGGFIYADGGLGSTTSDVEEESEITAQKNKKKHIPSLSERINKRLAKAKKALK